MFSVTGRNGPQSGWAESAAKAFLGRRIDESAAAASVCGDGQRCRPRKTYLISLLWDDANTIPYIVRYRGMDHGGLGADVLRDLRRESRDVFALMKKKIATRQLLMNGLRRTESLPQRIWDSLDACTSEAELMAFKAAYLPSTDKASDERARLAEAIIATNADAVMEGKDVDLSACVHQSNGAIENKSRAMNLLTEALLERLKAIPALRTVARSLIERRGRIVVQAVKKRDPKAKIVVHNRQVTSQNFAAYTGRHFALSKIKPHEFLAIQRGEQAKLLKTSLEMGGGGGGDVRSLHEQVDAALLPGIGEGKGAAAAAISKARFQVTQATADGPLIRSVWAEVKQALKQRCHRQAVDVFAANVRAKLLTRGVTGAVLGIDPGFKAGHKCCVIDDMGGILETFTIEGVPFGGSRGDGWGRGPEAKNKKSAERVEWMEPAWKRILEAIDKYRVAHVAVGNGSNWQDAVSTAAMAVSGAQRPVDFTVVDEAGSSVYSVSKVGDADLPSLDPKHRSAASIARRLQDPLAELVKVDPQSLGVGMYQHSVASKALKEALDTVLSDCVATVGVDANTASTHLLCRVPGLNSSLASAIVGWRASNGPLASKNALLDIRGIGEKTFQQCAGFLRIPSANDALDRTHVHPDDYDDARRVIAHLARQGKIDSNGKYRGGDEGVEGASLNQRAVAIALCSDTSQRSLSSHDYASSVDRCGSEISGQGTHAGADIFGGDEGAALEKRAEMLRAELGRLLLRAATEDGGRKGPVWDDGYMVSPLLIGRDQGFSASCFSPAAAPTVGSSTPGIVRNVTTFGMFISIPGFKEDGLVPANSLPFFDLSSKSRGRQGRSQAESTDRIRPSGFSIANVVGLIQRFPIGSLVVVRIDSVEQRNSQCRVTLSLLKTSSQDGSRGNGEGHMIEERRLGNLEGSPRDLGGDHGRGSQRMDMKQGDNDGDKTGDYKRPHGVNMRHSVKGKQKKRKRCAEGGRSQEADRRGNTRQKKGFEKIDGNSKKRSKNDDQRRAKANQMECIDLTTIDTPPPRGYIDLT